MSEAKRPTFNWMDLLWLLFLAGLALLPPVKEYHKQFILLAFGVVQLREGWLVDRLQVRGAAYVVLIKIGLATLLVNHTGEISINSSYGCRIFLALGDTVLDDASVRRLLFLPLPGSRGSGTGNSRGKLWPARHPNLVLFPGSGAGEPLCCREPAIDAAISGNG